MQYSEESARKTLNRGFETPSPAHSSYASLSNSSNRLNLNKGLYVCTYAYVYVQSKNLYDYVPMSFSVMVKYKRYLMKCHLILFISFENPLSD